MRRGHAVPPVFSGHYQDLGIESLKMHDSACNLILSVDTGEIRHHPIVGDFGAIIQPPPGLY